jgi:shikimate kinase
MLGVGGESMVDEEFLNGNSNERGSIQGRPNITVIGIMGCGKTTVGERLALSLGFGFVDIDGYIERKASKRIADIFSKDGEAAFRSMESAAIGRLADIRNHVISVGGGAIMDDDNWHLLKRISTVVWLSTPVEEIARRIVMSPDEIRKRPLLGELVNIEDKNERQKLLTERLSTIVSHRQQRYGEAHYVIEDAYSTPETTLQKLRAVLAEGGAI